MLKELLMNILFISSPFIGAIVMISLVNISRRYPILDKYLEKKK